ncbi:Phage tail completion protein R [Escherichia coli]|nr:Phage tail completion protein R [Escherichia coli]
MLKTDSLREAMTRSCRWCHANPEKFTIFVESGNIETTGETPSFVYRYQIVMFVMDYAGELDDLTLPLLAWLSENQPQLLLNPERNQDIKFSAVINDDGQRRSPVYAPPAGTAFASRAAVRAHRRQNTCRSQNPACPLPKATGRMYSRM